MVGIPQGKYVYEVYTGLLRKGSCPLSNNRKVSSCNPHRFLPTFPCVLDTAVGQSS